MANLGSAFDASQVEPAGDRSVLPAGEYLAAIAKSEVRDAKTAGNRYINLEFEVIDGPAKGRRFWTMLNLWNSNAQAVEIAQRELSSICHAVGKLRVSDTEELHAIPMLVRVTVKNDAYGEKNEVKGYKPANGGAPVVQQQAAVAQQAAGGAKRGPWA
jgi:hypothetical protein